MKQEFVLQIIGHWGAYPGPGEATSCYLLSAEGYYLMLDCGSGALSILQRYLPLEKINAVVISHYHADHWSDVPCLQYAARVGADLGRRKMPLEIYGPDIDPYLQSLTYKEYTLGRAYNPAASLKLGPFSLDFLPTRHPDPCYSIKVSYKDKVLVYSGDTEYFSGLEKFAERADCFICESSLSEEYLGKIPGHMSSVEAGKIAEAGKVKKLVLSHLPHFGKPEYFVEEAKKVYSGSVVLAALGMSLIL